jgi:chromate transporter
MLWSLFITFLKIGFISFGGGYAMIPIIQQEVFAHAWLSQADFADAVALAGMAPGPIATNSATLVGYKTAGLMGAIVSTSGMVFPSLIVIILIAAFFYKVHHNKWITASFYGLRPIVTGLIIYSAIHFGFSGQSNNILTWHTLATLLISTAAVFAILHYRMHPLTVILLSGFLGIAIFS